MEKTQLKKINDYLWEIPVSFRNDMKVPANIFAKEAMIDSLLSDHAIDQLINVATLPGIVHAAMVMPDVHEGYGFPIGGVAATEWPTGVISPGGIGYDINCGVRLMLTQLVEKDITSKIESLTRELFSQIPTGTGRGGDIKLNAEELDEVLKLGAEWAWQNGYATMEDLQFIESNGRLLNADPSAVSVDAKRRGYDQLGTLGAGNHFLEVDKVEAIFDKGKADVFGLFQDQVVILVHTGSRGLGHQVATDYLRLMMTAMPIYNLQIPDRELACVPFNSPEGQSYFSAMGAAANFAWCNRQMISFAVRSAFQKEIKISGKDINLLYDVAHNIAKIEEHTVDGVVKKLIVHRKGATRAFGPGHPEIPEKFRATGQPVLIPGSMGTASFVLAGTEKSMMTSFGSTCHGAGRRLSRTAAKKQIGGKALRDQLLKEQGVLVRSGSLRGISEEAPFAYKDIDMVVDTVHDAGIAVKVAKLKPLAVIKG